MKIFYVFWNTSSYNWGWGVALTGAEQNWTRFFKVWHSSLQLLRPWYCWNSTIKLLLNENLIHSTYNITSIKGNFSKCRYTGMILVANEIFPFLFIFLELCISSTSIGCQQWPTLQHFKLELVCGLLLYLWQIFSFIIICCVFSSK